MVLEIPDETAESSVAVNLSPQTQEDFTLHNGVNLQGVSWDAHGHESPKLDPPVSLGADSRLKGMVVGSFDGA
jgi:hypothetical protein